MAKSKASLDNEMAALLVALLAIVKLAAIGLSLRCNSSPILRTTAI